MTDQEMALWDTYYQDRTTDNRNALVEHYIGFLYSTARKFARKYNQEFDDMVTFASMGMIRGVETYDRVKHPGVAPTTLLAWRVWGTMLDELRRRWVQAGRIGFVNTGDDFPLLGKDAPEREAGFTELLDLCCDERERQVVDLRCREDLTWRQIAKRVGLSPQWCTTLFDRGVDKIRSHLAKGMVA